MKPNNQPILMVFLLPLLLPAGVQAAVTDDGDSLVVPAGESYSLGGEHAYLRQVRIDGTLSVEGQLELHAPQIAVGEAGLIDAHEQGDAGGAPGGQYPTDYGSGGQGPGAGAAGQASSNGNAGGGGGGAAGYGGDGTEGGFGGDANDHGAQGGQGGVGGRAYGQEGGRSIETGSGGGGAGSNTAGFVDVQPGAAGGGSIWLDGETITILGELDADGGKGGDGANSQSWNHGSGGGGGASGGGILLDAAQLVIGGRLHADGGDGGAGGTGDQTAIDPLTGQPDPAHFHNGGGGGGGGGGRIKLFALCREGHGTIEASGGAAGWGVNHDRPNGALPGSDGTIHSEGDVAPDGCSGPPRIVSGSPYTAGENEQVVLSVEGTRDPDRGQVTIGWDLDGDGAYDDAASWTVTVSYPDEGEYTVGVQAADDQGEVAVAPLVIRVVNLPPVIHSDPPLEAQEDTPWRYDLVVDDPGDDPLTLTLEQGPVGMTVDGLALAWTPTPEQALTGQFLVELTVTDSEQASAQQRFQLHVSWLDSDHDGMSDGWERKYGLNPNDPADAAQDLDGDGLTNLQEFQHGSDPTRFGKPDPPAIYRPEVGGEVGSLTPSLTVVNGVDPDADPLSYEFELHDSPRFDALLVSGAQLPQGAGETTSWQIVRPLGENGHYWWRARCSDGMLLSDWSDAGEFWVNADQEPPVALSAVAPADGMPVGTATPELVVSGTSDPDRDAVVVQFQLYTDPGLTTLAAQSPDRPAAAEGADNGWTVDPPLLEDSIYWWRARAVDDTGLASGWTEVRMFKVNQNNAAPPAPQLVAPSPDAIVADPRTQLSLRNVEDPDGDAVSYTVELDADPGYATPDHFRQEGVLPGANGFTVIDPGRLLDDTRYHWRALATDGLLSSPWAEASFVVSRANDPPGAPEPLEPDDGSQLRTSTPLLRVGPAHDPEDQPLTYRFEVSPTRDFADEEQLLRSDRLPAEEGGGASWTTPVLADGRKWYWRCQAFDPLRLASPYSPVRELLVLAGAGGAAPPVPPLFSPADGATVGVHPALAAGAVQDPDGDPVHYIFRLSGDPTFATELARSPGVAIEGEEVSWTVEDALAPGVVYWQVRSTDGFHESDWSSAWSFTVDPRQESEGQPAEAAGKRSSGSGCALAATGGEPGRGGLPAAALLLGLGLGLVVLRRR